MTLSADFHIHGTPAAARDYRTFVALLIKDKSDNAVTVYFDTKAALTRWLAEALGEAFELPQVVPGAAVCADGSGAPTTPPTPSPGAQFGPVDPADLVLKQAGVA